MLCDQGMLILSRSQQAQHPTQPSFGGGSPRYMAPELFKFNKPQEICVEPDCDDAVDLRRLLVLPVGSKESDVYSFAMTLYHVRLVI
jgi:serine/threonine protein kinase